VKLAWNVEEIFLGGLWAFAKTFFYFVLIPGVLVGIITMITESPYFLIGGGITCVILWIIVGGEVRMVALYCLSRNDLFEEWC
jgi:hypothetical protein